MISLTGMVCNRTVRAARLAIIRPPQMEVSTHTAPHTRQQAQPKSEPRIATIVRGPPANPNRRLRRLQGYGFEHHRTLTATGVSVMVRHRSIHNSASFLDCLGLTGGLSGCDC